MRKIWGIFFALLFVNDLFAVQISESEALLNAQAFVKKAVSKRLMKEVRTPSAIKLAYTERNADKNCFYVFNRGENGGYIIVAAEDRTNEILGYTDSGNFDYDSISENMKWWLGEYSREIKYLIEHPEIKTKEAEVKALDKAVLPLLGAIAWDQGAPYNDQCPMYDDSRRCATGCLATAMAQIMYYHRWPLQGTGSYSYTTEINGKNVNLSADFGNTVYDWNNMLPSYSGASTPEQNEAVATLMSHCGISIDMEYGLESGAMYVKIPDALYNYFGYDKGVSYKARNYYNINEWENIIRRELDEGRVIEYNGQAGDGGGHSFLCDGYNTAGFFHINWGWSGQANGYFMLTALLPGTQGIGGSDGGFNYSQGMVVGIQKPNAGTVASYEICADNGMLPASEEIVKGSSVKISIEGLWNLGWNAASVELALILFDTKNGEEVFTQSLTNGILELPGMRGWTSIDWGLRIPGNVPDGNYKLSLCYRADGTDDWKKVRIAIEEPEYLNVEIANNLIRFSQSTTETPVLNVENINLNTKIYNDDIVSISATVSNNGGEYYAPLHFGLFDNAGKNVFSSEDYIVDIIGGETVVVEFKEKVSVDNAGNYNLGIMDYNGSIIGSVTPVTVYNKSTKSPEISLDKALTFDDNNNVPLDNMNLKVSIKNTGGLFSGTLIATIFPEDSNSPIYSFPRQLVVVDENQIEDIIFKGDFLSGTIGSKYKIAVFETSGAKLTPTDYNVCWFTLAGPLSSVSGIEASKNKVYPNPANDNITVESEYPIQYLRIYSASGQLVLESPANRETKKDVDVSLLIPGNYFIMIETGNGNFVESIIKK